MTIASRFHQPVARTASALELRSVDDSKYAARVFDGAGALQVHSRLANRLMTHTEHPRKEFLSQRRAKTLVFRDGQTSE